jgi:uncharacterized protein
MNYHDKKQIIRQTEDFIRARFTGDSSGHDWWHIHRVRNLALKLAKRENAEEFIVEMAALLHDLDDWKMAPAGNQVKNWLDTLRLSEDENVHILNITSAKRQNANQKRFRYGNTPPPYYGKLS